MHRCLIPLLVLATATATAIPAAAQATSAAQTKPAVHATPAAQATSADTLGKALAGLPADLALKEATPQQYVFTTDYFNLDPVGTLKTKERVSAEYTRGLPDGKVRWDNVRIAEAKTLDETFPEGAVQAYMNGFSYKLGNLTETFAPSFFAGFPDDLRTKTLVWDVGMFEVYAWSWFDKLKLNEPYRLKLEPTAMPGGGVFNNRQPELTWIGVSERNGKSCALIQYEAFFNSLTLSPGGMPLTGRSHYFGMIWVALEDKQLEYATLREDVLCQIEVPGPNGKQNIIANTFRIGTLQRKAK